MKKIFLFLFLSGIFAACGKPAAEKFATAEKAVVTGRAANLKAGTTDLDIIIFRLGLDLERLLVPIDSAGNFRVEFETYAPASVSVRTPQILSLTVFPGDTIHAEFDGGTRNAKKYYESLRIAGDHAQANKDMETFNILFFEDSPLMDFGRIFGAMKTYTPEQFVSFMDTMQTIGDALYDRFVETCSPAEEAKVYARSLIDLRNPDFLGQYISKYDRDNIHRGDVELPSGLSEKMVVPLNEQMLLFNLGSVGTYTNRMHFQYVNPKVEKYLDNEFNLTNTESVTPSGRKRRTVTIPSEEMPRYDSLARRKLVEFTPDPLLKQLVLMEEFKQGMPSQAGIERYEANLAFIDSVITLPYLRKPLHDYYLSTKARIENPVLHQQAVLKQLESSSAGEIMQSILDENRGKVVYIDVWATWCAPCKAEMPFSRKLMQEMEGRDVVFVYLCVDSNESTWKADLDAMKLAGQQYFLTAQQSAAFRQAFEINGVPEYLLFDREGNLAARSLRPSSEEIRKKFDELLE